MDLLRWNHQWGGQLKVWNLLIEKGKDPPPEYYTRPEIDPALFYLQDAFSALSTERQIGMTIGAIPRSKIKEYGRDDLGLTGDGLDRFIAVIGMIDDEYFAIISAKRDPDVVPVDGKGVRGLVKKPEPKKARPSLSSGHRK